MNNILLVCRWLNAVPNLELFVKPRTRRAVRSLGIFYAKRPHRGTPKTAYLSLSHCRSKIPIRNRRTASELAENAAQRSSKYMPNISDIVQDACFAVILHGVDEVIISYECPEYGLQEVSS